MLDVLFRSQDDTAALPSYGVTIGITHHPQTVGRHRIRFHFSRPVAEALRHGLAYPRVHIDGTAVNGFRIWCSDEGGLAPVLNRNGAYTVTIPARRVRAREAPAGSAQITFEWDRDDSGPVLVIPRVPDQFLPEAIIDKLPNSAVDPETLMDRADKRLRRDMATLCAEAPEIHAEPEPAPEPPQPPEPQPQPPAAIDGDPVPDDDAAELRAAIALVNDLVDLIGDGVQLAIDDAGHVTARRRVCLFVDL